MRGMAQIFIFLFMPVQLFSQSIEGTFVSKYDRFYDGFAFPEDVITHQSEIAWIGERIYFHMLLKGKQEINSLEYESSRFTNEQGIFLPCEVQIGFALSVKGDDQARSCAGYPNRSGYSLISDALTSDTARTINVDEIISIYLIMDIPQEAVPGLYQATFLAKTETQELHFNLEIEVIDLRLPRVEDWSFHLDIWQFPTAILDHYNSSNSTNQIGLWSDDHFNLILPAYMILAEAGQKAITTHIKEGSLGSPSMIKWIKDADQMWHYDFSAFDRYVEQMISIGIDEQINCFSPVGWNESTIPYWDEADQKFMDLHAPLDSEEFLTRWDHFLSVFKSHLVEKNWFDITVLYLDEVTETKLNRVIEMVRANDSEWKLGIAYTHSISESTKADFYDFSGILEAASNHGIAKEKISTFYTSCTQRIPNSYVTKENSIAEMAWMAYYASNKGFDGYLRWAYDNWKLSDPLDARDGANTAGDYSIIYRSGNKMPVNFYPSLRLEMLREGVEEYEKINMLTALYSNSENPADSILSVALDSVLSMFDLQSAPMARELVPLAQLCIAGIATGNLDGCKKGNNSTSAKTLISKPGQPVLVPNPNTGIFQIMGLKEPILQIQITNQNGQIVYIDNRISCEPDCMDIYFNPGNKGLYFVKMVTENGPYNSSLLIE